MKKNILIVSGIIAITIISIGVKMYMGSKKLDDEMINVVKSDEAKEIFGNSLKNLDPKAFTDEDSIKHNPR